jgi:beta-glucosidase
LKEALNDTMRIHYFAGYLNALLEAVLDDGVPVLGYFAWSILEYVI